MPRQPPGDRVLDMDKLTDTRAACTSCGRRNDEDANFCQNCGIPIVRKPEPSKARLVITERAVRELKSVRAMHTRDERDVLRIDSESDGLSLSVAPPENGDCIVGSEDTILLHASTGAARLLEERIMVIHCIDGRLIIYAEEDESGAEAST